MNFREILQARYSCRAYKPDPVEGEKLDLCLDAARLAPTACNRQAFELHVIQADRHQAELRRLYHREWFSKAPVVIGIVAQPGKCWVRMDGRNYGDVDCAIAMDHLILQATELGLGTCWVAAFDPAVARSLLKLTGDREPIAFTPLGYPADTQEPRVRRPIEDLVRRLD